VLYLGAINDSERCAWEKTISVFDDTQGAERQLALFPADRMPPEGDAEAVQVRLDQLRLENPWQWGGRWPGDHLWCTLHLDDFFGASYEVPLYDFSSTYFDCDAPYDASDPRRFGYSRDKRSDCVQVVVAPVVTPTDRLTAMNRRSPGARGRKCAPACASNQCPRTAV